MMKKLMVLSLVLGMATLASAGFVVTGSPVNPGEVFNIAFYADGNVAGLTIREIKDTAVPSGMIQNIVLNEKLSVGRQVGNGLVAEYGHCPRRYWRRIQPLRWIDDCRWRVGFLF